CRGPFGVVESRSDEDAARHDHGERRQPERVPGGDTQRVVDAGTDVAVAGCEQSGRPQHSGQAHTATFDDNPDVAGQCASLPERLFRHRAQPLAYSVTAAIRGRKGWAKRRGGTIAPCRAGSGVPRFHTSPPLSASRPSQPSSGWSGRGSISRTWRRPTCCWCSGSAGGTAGLPPSRPRCLPSWPTTGSWCLPSARSGSAHPPTRSTLWSLSWPLRRLAAPRAVREAGGAGEVQESGSLYELAIAALREPVGTAALSLLCQRATTAGGVEAMTLVAADGAEVEVVAGAPLAQGELDQARD